MELDFLTCMDYLISEDLEAQAIDHLFSIYRGKKEQADNKLSEQKAVIRAARKINEARIKDDAISALLEE